MAKYIPTNFDLRYECLEKDMPSDEVRRRFEEIGLKSIGEFKGRHGEAKTSYVVNGLFIAIQELSSAEVHGESRRGVFECLEDLSEKTGVYFC